MAARVKKDPNQKKSAVNSPKSSEEWQALAKDAIAKAESANDRRIAGLKQALIVGNVESHLRKLGIMCIEDLMREFPEKKS